MQQAGGNAEPSPKELNVLLTESAAGRAMIGVGRVLSEVEVRGPNRHRLEFASIAFSNVNDILRAGTALSDSTTKWLPSNGFIGRVHHVNATVGGTHAMSFTNFTNGQSDGWCDEYVELVQDKRIRYADTFDDPKLSGKMETTITLKAVPSGTDISIVLSGIADAMPLDGRYVGWQQSLALLALLVESKIPG